MSQCKRADYQCSERQPKHHLLQVRDLQVFQVRDTQGSDYRGRNFTDQYQRSTHDRRLLFHISYCVKSRIIWNQQPRLEAPQGTNES